MGGDDVMIDSLQITIEPNIYLVDETDKPIIKNLRIQVIRNDVITQKNQLYQEDEFTSFFDYIFDKAKREIKGALLEHDKKG